MRIAKKSKPALFLIGVTGSFGSGKSTVADWFEKVGAVVINADCIVHDLLNNHSGCQKQIQKNFGKHVVIDGKVDRAKLASVVFNDKAMLKCLENILHPLAWRETQTILRRAKKDGKKVAVIDAPLLIEAGWHRQVNALIVVESGKEQQITRLQKRMKISRAEVAARLRHQLSLSGKRKYADFIVDNRGRKSDTYKQVKNIWEHIKNHAMEERVS